MFALLLFPRAASSLICDKPLLPGCKLAELLLLQKGKTGWRPETAWAMMTTVYLCSKYLPYDMIYKWTCISIGQTTEKVYLSISIAGRTFRGWRPQRDDANE